MFALYSVLLLGIPAIAACLLFTYALLLSQAKADNKKNPGAHSETELRHYKRGVIICSIITGVFVLILLGLVGLLAMAVMFM